MAKEFTLQDFIKINDYTYEIPTSYRSDMRVPARVFMNEALFQDIKGDRSLHQLVNMTTLPGIQQYAFAMPDIHQGYGFPIGGVAGLAINEGGVISPGGIGYDINCLNPEARVSVSHGAYVTIEELVTKQYSHVSFMRIDGQSKQEATVMRWMKRKEEKSLYHIKTKYGYELKATGDHPIFNGTKMIDAAKLVMGDSVVVDPFSGVPYQEPADDVLVCKDYIVDALRSLELECRGSRYGQIFAWLHNRGLLEIRRNSWQLPYLIKLIGVVLGDGTANVIGKAKKGRISIYGCKNDLEDIQRDLVVLDVKSNIYSRMRKHKMVNAYNKKYEFTVTEHALCVNSTAFLVLLKCLGLPLGNKTTQKFSVPRWLEQSPLWHKRLFLASFFGAEMSKPSTLNAYNFYSKV